jgi:hypothetical protein
MFDYFKSIFFARATQNRLANIKGTKST